jgi:two-component system response regulator LytT
MLTAIVADDEQLAREELLWLLKDFPDVEVIAIAANGIEAVDVIEKLEPEVVFLDVQMPGLDGMGVVRRLRERKIILPRIVFATAFDQYAVEAFRLEAFDYILKPVDKRRLSETIERVRREVSEEQSLTQTEVRPASQRAKILIRKGDRNFIIDPQELIYATIDNGIISLVATTVEGHSNYRTLEDLQANLDPDVFWRTHRSFLVNINRIREVVPWFNSSYQLRVDDKKGTEIPVSRVQTRRLRELLKL